MGGGADNADLILHIHQVNAAYCTWTYFLIIYFVFGTLFSEIICREFFYNTPYFLSLRSLSLEHKSAINYFCVHRTPYQFLTRVLSYLKYRSRTQNLECIPTLWCLGVMRVILHDPLMCHSAILTITKALLCQRYCKLVLWVKFFSWDCKLRVWVEFVGLSCGLSPVLPLRRVIVHPKWRTLFHPFRKSSYPSR